jgi:hypothetical protein
MILVSLNGNDQEVSSLEDLYIALDRFGEETQLELWLKVPEGPSLCMLRNGPHAWLMYLQHDDDGGLRSQGEAGRLGVASFKLGNGQVDEYPLSWCIELEKCYQAVAYFFVNAGVRPPRVAWWEE